MRGEPKVSGAETGVPLKLVKDPATGQILMKAGGGQWTLPGSMDMIQVRDRELWLYRDGEPICQLAQQVSAPPDGSVSFDVTPQGTLAVTVEKSGRRYLAEVKLEEI